MLEPKTLRRLRVPDPTRVPISVMRELATLGHAVVNGDAAVGAEQAIDDIVSDLYQLEAEDRTLLGVER